MSKREPKFEEINMDELDEVQGGCHGGFGFNGFNGFPGGFQGLPQQGGPANLQALLAASPNGGSYQWSWDSASGFHGSFTDGSGATQSFNGVTAGAPGVAAPSGGGGGFGT